MLFRKHTLNIYIEIGECSHRGIPSGNSPMWTVPNIGALWYRGIPTGNSPISTHPRTPTWLDTGEFQGVLPIYQAPSLLGIVHIGEFQYCTFVYRHLHRVMGHRFVIWWTMGGLQYDIAMTSMSTLEGTLWTFWFVSLNTSLNYTPLDGS